MVYGKIRRKGRPKPWYPKPKKRSGCITPTRKAGPWYPSSKKKKCNCPRKPRGMDTAFTPTRQGYPPNSGGGLSSLVGVIAYFLPGASRTKPDGSDRLGSDLKAIRDIWGLQVFPYRRINVSTNFGLTQSELTCSNALRNNSKFHQMVQRRLSDESYADYITIWYVPINIFADNQTIACAYTNVRLPGSNVETQHIIMTERSLNTNNTLAHEMGHIFFGTIPNENNNFDPTSGNSPHSNISGNVMSAGGDGSGVLSSQKQKFFRSRLAPRGIGNPS